MQYFVVFFICKGIMASIAVILLSLSENNENSEVLCFVWKTIQVIFTLLAQVLFITLFFLDLIQSHFIGTKYEVSPKAVLIIKILTIIFSFFLLITLYPWILNQCQKIKIETMYLIPLRLAQVSTALVRAISMCMCLKWYCNRIKQVCKTNFKRCTNISECIAILFV